ncbi:hypothetical protein N0V90_010092 [Kalmusia sp. IMI 367209]|nr:hypothetical protein N0V90_010092 [Kalmusia sp. IMI 367209]
MRRLPCGALATPPSTLFPAQRVPRLSRFQSTVSTRNEPTTASLSPRWLSDLKTRVGKCINFGISNEQTREAGAILQEMGDDWRDLVAGSEGFLTGKGRWGLYRHQVAWGEMVQLRPVQYCECRHVNNVTYNRWAESARVNWALNMAAMDAEHRGEWKALIAPTGIGMILRSIRTDYKFPLVSPDRVTVLHKLRSKPKADTDHFILDVLILSEVHRRIAARCVEDIVVYDYQAAKKSSMKPFMVKKLQETFALQEQAKERCGNKAVDLIKRVVALEKASWDRPDAKEDFGNANP